MALVLVSSHRATLCALRDIIRELIVKAPQLLVGSKEQGNAQGAVVSAHDTALAA